MAGPPLPRQLGEGKFVRVIIELDEEPDMCGVAGKPARSHSPGGTSAGYSESAATAIKLVFRPAGVETVTSCG